VDATFEALAVVTLALLPGALFVAGAERQVGRAGTADRLVAFGVASALLHAIAAPLTWWVVTGYVTSGRLAQPDVPWVLWPVVLGFVVVPFAAGLVAGWAHLRSMRYQRILPGPGPSPLAWDAVFAAAAARSAWVRLRLKDTTAGNHGWVFGAFTPGGAGGMPSWASAYPRAADLFLSATFECDGQGRPLRGPGGGLRPRRYGLLVRWDEVLYLEVSW
jgi:hypothetical protein